MTETLWVAGGIFTLGLLLGMEESAPKGFLQHLVALGAGFLLIVGWPLVLGFVLGKELVRHRPREG